MAFTIGALLPLLTITLASAAIRVWSRCVAVVVALAITGWTSARLGYGRPAGPSCATSPVASSRWR